VLCLSNLTHFNILSLPQPPISACYMRLIRILHQLPDFVNESILELQ
jgi:hypothetical protein